MDLVRFVFVADSHRCCAEDLQCLAQPRAKVNVLLIHFVTAELPALRRALSLAEAESAPYHLEILSDSKAALTQLANLERALPLTGELANAAIMLQR
ncbi:hypothetical protein HPB47_012304 [Ixodes persulcatus]|uniref:Uncharacterized protein n=1 Tax=Ixodes persulcatus TaxID=34615 RepID=A0AC60NTY0_IXOPE|nr:hypothetical protein HPB47_012304 [Ixodes persulcatus]